MEIICTCIINKQNRNNERLPLSDFLLNNLDWIAPFEVWSEDVFSCRWRVEYPCDNSECRPSAQPGGWGDCWGGVRGRVRLQEHARTHSPRAGQHGQPSHTSGARQDWRLPCKLAPLLCVLKYKSKQLDTVKHRSILVKYRFHEIAMLLLHIYNIF